MISSTSVLETIEAEQSLPSHRDVAAFVPLNKRIQPYTLRRSFPFWMRLG
jgi:hypothetical protein